MAQTITLDEVRRLAELSRLELTDAEAIKYQKELCDVLDYFAILDGVSTEGLKPTNQVTGLKNVVRKDIVTKQIAQANDLLALAPDSQDNYVKVKRMI